MQLKCRAPLSISLTQILVIAFAISAVSSDVHAVGDRFVALTGWDSKVNPTSFNGCRNSTDPCRTLARAIFMASGNGTIKIGPGNFSDSSVQITSSPTRAVNLVIEGGWNSDFTQRTAETGLSALTFSPTPPWPGINSNARLFRIEANGQDLTVTLDRLSMWRGSAPIGGCILVQATSGPGGGSFGSATATLTIRDSRIGSCLAEKGGAIAVVLPSSGDGIDYVYDENRIYLNLINSRITNSSSTHYKGGNAIYAQIVGSEAFDEGLSGFFLTIHDSVIKWNDDGTDADIYITTSGLNASTVLDFKRNTLIAETHRRDGLIQLWSSIGGSLTSSFQNNLLFNPYGTPYYGPAILVACRGVMGCAGASLNHLHDTILGSYVLQYSMNQAGIATLNLKNSILGGPLRPILGLTRSRTNATAEWSIVQEQILRDGFDVNIESVFEYQRILPDFRLSGDSWAVDRVICEPTIQVDRQGDARPDPITGKCDVGSDEHVHEIFNAGGSLLYDGGSDPVADIFSILNAGCESDTGCGTAGSPTTLEIETHALFLPSIRTYQGSTARISGGRFRDGTIFEAYHDSNIDFVGSDFRFFFSPRIRFSGFLPLPMGPLRITGGLLFGRLESSLSFGPFQVERYGGGELRDLADMTLLPGANSVLLNAGPFPTKGSSNIIDQPIDVFAFVRDKFCDDQSWPCAIRRPALALPTTVIIDAPTMTFHVYDTSNATLRRGVIRGDLVVANRASMVVRGGEVQGRVGLFDAAELVIRGGELQKSVGLFDRGQLLISGGKVADRVIASDSSHIDLEEGDVSTTIFILEKVAKLVVHGKDFELDGSPQALGELDVGSGTLTGVYGSDTAFSLYFERHDHSRIQLVAVPEPVSMLMQAMSLIVIAALRGRSMSRASR